MTGRKNCALQVPLVVPYKALEKFSKALYGATEGTCSARFFRPVMTPSCYRNQDKLRPDEPLDSYADLTYFCNLRCIANFAGFGSSSRSVVIFI